MKKLLLIATILCVTGVDVLSQNTVTGRLTLQQCIEIGIANNLDVLQSDLQAQSDEINWKQAKTNMLPNLSASVTQRNLLMQSRN